MTHIFISYSRSDKHYAERIADKLKLGGLEVWWDTSLLAGDDWDIMLDEAIKQSLAMVVVLTDNAIESHWVTYEWVMASTLGIRVIPLMVEEVDIKSIHRKLERFQIERCINLEGGDLEKLVTLLKSVEQPLDAIRNAPNKDIRGQAKLAVLELARFNENVFLQLLEALSDHDHNVRAAVADILGDLRRPEAVQKLTEALRDDWSSVRGDAAEALGKIGDSGAVKDLIRALYDLVPIVRRDASKALGLIGHSNAVLELISMLDDEAASVKIAAVESLGKIKDRTALEPAIEPLINLLPDTTKPYGAESIGEQAAQALVFIGTPAALKAAREWRRKNPKPDMEF